MHCRDTKTFPVVPRHGLVSYRGVPVSMVRQKKLLKAPKCLISLITVFLGHPVVVFEMKKKKTITSTCEREESWVTRPEEGEEGMQ